MRPSLRLSSLFAALALSGVSAAVLAGSGLAQAQSTARDYRVQEHAAGTRLRFDADPDLSNFTLSVSGPNGYAGTVSSARVPPSFRLADHGDVVDGVYSFEMTAATQERRRDASPQQAAYNGRDPRSGTTAYLGYTYSGAFRVVNGRIMEFDQAEQEG